MERAEARGAGMGAAPWVAQCPIVGRWTGRCPFARRWVRGGGWLVGRAGWRRTCLYNRPGAAHSPAGGYAARASPVPGRLAARSVSRWVGQCTVIGRRMRGGRVVAPAGGAAALSPMLWAWCCSFASRWVCGAGIFGPGQVGGPSANQIAMTGCQSPPRARMPGLRRMCSATAVQMQGRCELWASTGAQSLTPCHQRPDAGARIPVPSQLRSKPTSRRPEPGPQITPCCRVSTSSTRRGPKSDCSWSGLTWMAGPPMEKASCGLVALPGRKGTPTEFTPGSQSP